MLDLHTLAAVLTEHRDALAHRVRPFDLGGRACDFERERPLMGVINLSPESWYAESVCADEAAAVARGLALTAAGAALVDIGAESTLAHAARVPPAEQQARLVPVVRALSAQGVVVSVESYWPEVLEACALAGARVFNLTGRRAEADVLALARRFGAAVVLCYVQGETVRDVGRFTFAADMMDELTDHFRERTALAERHGVSRCILDPGLGFYYANLADGALRVNHQLHTFLHSFRLHRLGYPILNILPHAPDIFGEAHRRAAEPLFAVLAWLLGTHIVRTHELEVVARYREVLAAYRAGGG